MPSKYRLYFVSNNGWNFQPQLLENSSCSSPKIPHTKQIALNETSIVQSHLPQLQKKQQACSLCKQLHFIAACPHYLEASTSDKLEFVRKHQLRFNCLSCSHWKKDCPARNYCFVPGCSALHHSSLHPVDKTAPRSSPTVRSANTCKRTSNAGRRSSESSQPGTHAQKLHPSNDQQNSRRSQQPNRTKSPNFNATALNNDNSKLPTNLLSLLLASHSRFNHERQTNRRHLRSYRSW